MVDNENVSLLTTYSHLSDNTMDLINSKHKARGTSDHKRLIRAVKKACKKDLQNWLTEKADIMNEAYNNNNQHTLFKTADSLLGKRTTPLANIKDENGTTLTTLEQELKRWESYAHELFQSDNTRPPPTTHICQPDLPTNSEISKALKSLKNNKATGSDHVAGEFIKAMAEDFNIRERINHAVHRIWQTGKWPPSMSESVYIAIHKKNCRGTCANYRTLALISHASKIVLYVIQQRLDIVVKKEVSSSQCGFISGRSTVDAIFRVKGISQAYLAVRKPLHMVFVDFKKAFDSVLHTKLFEILRDFNTPEDVVRLIEALYNTAKGTISWKGGLTNLFNTPVGVRQGCPISASLFNLYTEHLMRLWISLIQHIEAPNVNGIQCYEQRYADDLVLMALCSTDAENMLTTLGNVAEQQYGLHIHKAKTEYMVIQPTMEGPTIKFRGCDIQRVPVFRYLGTIISHNLDDSQEIRTRIAIAKDTLNRCTYLKSPRINLSTKLHIIRALVASRLTYGCSTWSVKASDENRLDALGREIWRRLLGYTWSDRLSNNDLHQLIDGRWTFSFNTIMERKAAWCGHAHRHGGLTSAVIAGLPEGTSRSRGRPSMRWVDNLTRWSGLTTPELETAALNRTALRQKPIVALRRSGRQRANQPMVDG